MADGYKATAARNPGRKAWLVDFRHPLKNDNSNKPGKKIRKGLGTESEVEAQEMARRLTALLADDQLWSIGARRLAEEKYGAKVASIFFSEIEPPNDSARTKLDQLVELPEGFARVLLLGVPGAGKTTLLRQLIGTNPETERFPSTSINRTTTYPTEIILGPGPYKAVVSFMSEHEARFEVEECVSAAVIAAVGGDVKHIARDLLQKSDMRFRLKYVIGALQGPAEHLDPYDTPEESADQEAVAIDAAEQVVIQEKLGAYISQVVAIADRLVEAVEASQGSLSSMPPDDRNAALDLIQEQATASDEFVELVSDILDEIRLRFAGVHEGRFEKTTSGWPRTWYLECGSDSIDARTKFFKAVRYFSGIAHQAWGTLLTPLVNGMRVAGPFSPKWADLPSGLVLIDTEGLGHKASATADVSDDMLALIYEAQAIVLVDSAKTGTTNTAGKALEAVVNAGQTKKLSVVFTHMDATGDNLRGQAKYDHVAAGLRNLIENQVAESVSVEAARYLAAHLETATFYLGRIDQSDATAAHPELRRLLEHLQAARPAVFEPVALPEYSIDNLAFAIQEGARDFRHQWQAMLGLSSNPDFAARPWQTLKALSRRYAENWDDGFVLQPTSSLRSLLAASVSRFLEHPLEWSGSPTDDQKREVIDAIKAVVVDQLKAMAARRLREQAQATWHEAYSFRGFGSTFNRRITIEEIYARWVPVPDARGDRIAFDFLDETKQIVLAAIQQIRDKVEHPPLQT